MTPRTGSLMLLHYTTGSLAVEARTPFRPQGQPGRQVLHRPAAPWLVQYLRVRAGRAPIINCMVVGTLVTG